MAMRGLKNRTFIGTYIVAIPNLFPILLCFPILSQDEDFVLILFHLYVRIVGPSTLNFLSLFFATSFKRPCERRPEDNRLPFVAQIAAIPVSIRIIVLA